METCKDGAATTIPLLQSNNKYRFENNNNEVQAQEQESDRLQGQKTKDETFYSTLDSSENNYSDFLPVEETPESAKIIEKEQIPHLEQPPHGWKRFLGILLTILATMLFAMNGLIMKAIRDRHPMVWGVWQFLFFTLLCVPFVLYSAICEKAQVLKTIWPWSSSNKGNIRNLIFLGGRSFVGVSSLICLCYSVRFMNVADTFVISSSSPIFVYFLAYFFLGEQCGVIPIVNALLALIGVAFIARPPLLTGNESFDTNTLIGTSLALGAMSFIATGFIFVRLLQNVHTAIINIAFGLWGVIQCLIIAFALGVMDTPSSIQELGLFAASGACGCGATLLLNIALRYEQAGPVSLCRSCEVVFAFVYQLLFLGISPDKFSLIGATAVLLGVSLTAIRKMLTTLPPSHKYRKRFKLLLY